MLTRYRSVQVRVIGYGAGIGYAIVCRTSGDSTPFVVRLCDLTIES